MRVACFYAVRRLYYDGWLVPRLQTCIAVGILYAVDCYDEKQVYSRLAVPMKKQRISRTYTASGILSL